MITIDEHSPIRDPQGHYADWLARHEVVAVLQRPDFSIFGTTASVDDVDALLSNLRDVLAGPSGG